MATMTHAERADRRRQIAAMAKDHSAAEISEILGVSWSTVYQALRSRGVKAVPKTARERSINYAIVADLMTSTASHQELANKHSVDLQRIRQVADDCRAAGIKLSPPE